ncbi:MAG: hypothetical protein WBY93_16085 [Candidatus Binatus sp.]|jgi:hypothetical protein
MRKDTDKEREFIARLQAEMPELLGGTWDFEALFGHIQFSNGDCVSIGAQPRRIFSKPKKRRRKT